MKHTQKMVLVPYDKYVRLTKSTTASDTDTTQQYDIPINAEPSEHGQSNHTTYQPDHHVSLKNIFSDDSILSVVPANMRSMAQMLLNHIHQHTPITWNEHGQLVIDGQVIPYSHIADLIKDALVDYMPMTMGDRSGGPVFASG